MAETLTPPPGPPPLASEAGLLLEPGEHVFTVVRKSIIVLIGLYLEILAGIAALGALIFVLAPDTFRDLIHASSGTLTLILVLFVALIIFILVLVTHIYLQNKLLITDRSIIQMTQRGPFAHKASRLSIASVEDVSADQRGFLPTAFNYGTLLIQTAGTLDNFEFTNASDPNKYAHQILEARAAYAEALREESEPHP